MTKDDKIVPYEYVAPNLTLASARLDSSGGEVRHPRRMD